MSKATLQAVEKRISDEAKAIEQAKARLQRLNAQKRMLSRSERTRRLILIGAVVVAKAEAEEAFKAELRNWLDAGLTDNRDRVLFDLEPHENAKMAAKTSAVQGL